MVRPDLLLKLSTICEQFDKNGANNDLFKWKDLITRNEDDFAKTFNQFGHELSANELGEIRNLLNRMDEIIEVGELVFLLTTIMVQLFFY